MANETSKLDFLESPEALADKITSVQPFFEKNKKLIFSFGIGIVAGVASFLAYSWYTTTQDEEGQVALSPLVYQMESDSLEAALKGKPGKASLLTVADDFGSSAAGNLANFYAGTALLKQGKFDEAIDKLKSFSSSDLLVQARAYSLIGDAYSEKGNTEEAISAYKKAADYKPNQFFTPVYLLKLGIAQEKAKQYKEAAESYNTITEKYPLSAEFASAKKYKAQVEGSMSE
jgi:predicted negative regulator of RcsB-dependent stress response